LDDLLGLNHCFNFGCLMEDAHRSVLTSDHEYDLCDQCRQKLKEKNWIIPDQAKIVWTQVSKTP
jgi:predicted Zn-dependent protease